MVDWDDEENGESEMEPFEEVSETDVSVTLTDVSVTLSRATMRNHELKMF